MVCWQLPGQEPQLVETHCCADARHAAKLKQHLAIAQWIISRTAAPTAAASEAGQAQQGESAPGWCRARDLSSVKAALPFLDKHTQEDWASTGGSHERADRLPHALAGAGSAARHRGLCSCAASSAAQPVLHASGGRRLQVGAFAPESSSGRPAQPFIRTRTGERDLLCGRPLRSAGRHRRPCRRSRLPPATRKGHKAAPAPCRLTQHWYLLPGLTLPIPVSVGLFRGDKGWVRLPAAYTHWRWVQQHVHRVLVPANLASTLQAQSLFTSFVLRQVIVDAGTKNNRRQSHANNLVKAVQAAIPAGQRVAAIARASRLERGGSSAACCCGRRCDNPCFTAALQTASAVVVAHLQARSAWHVLSPSVPACLMALLIALLPCFPQ